MNNNNKIYKKWTLGLVAPALVLAPIAVVASCSSSTTTESTTKKATTAKSEIAIKTLVSEINEKTTAEKFKTGFDAAEENKKQKLVFDNVANLLDGDHKVEQADQIISPKLTDVKDDKTKLTLSFKLAANTWYGSDGNLSSSESSEFSISITGFAAGTETPEAPKPTGTKTEPKASVDVTTIDEQFKQVEAATFKAEEESVLKEFVVEKNKDLFSGDNNIKTKDDVVSAVLEDGTSNTQLKFKVKLKARTWYKDDGSLSDQDSAEFEITLINFKAPATQPGPGGKN